MFNFFKKNKYGLSKTELEFAKELNFVIRDKQLAILLIENIHTIAKAIYHLSTRRAKVKSFDIDEINNNPDEFVIDNLFNNSNAMNHIEVFNVLPEALKKSLGVIAASVKIHGISDEKSFNMTQEVLSTLLDETSKRLR